nr:MAG TPA: hypothetical protein [Caudoviricetes sp.]DAY27581.1 MAG TPA: hypothetical protein [Caudoviricetes sp.]
MMCFFIVIFQNIVNITTLIKEKSYNNIETKIMEVLYGFRVIKS